MDPARGVGTLEQAVEGLVAGQLALEGREIGHCDDLGAVIFALEVLEGRATQPHRDAGREGGGEGADLARRDSGGRVVDGAHDDSGSVHALGSGG